MDRPGIDKIQCRRLAKITGVDKPVIDTIKYSRSRFTKRDQLKADRVRRFKHVAGFPSDETLIYSCSTNGIKNNPMTTRDVKIAADILGRSPYVAKGKTTRTQPSTVDGKL